MAARRRALALASSCRSRFAPDPGFVPSSPKSLNPVPQNQVSWVDTCRGIRAVTARVRRMRSPIAARFRLHLRPINMKYESARARDSL